MGKTFKKNDDRDYVGSKKNRTIPSYRQNKTATVDRDSKVGRQINHDDAKQNRS